MCPQTKARQDGTAGASKAVSVIWSCSCSTICWPPSTRPCWPRAQNARRFLSSKVISGSAAKPVRVAWQGEPGGSGTRHLWRKRCGRLRGPVSTSCEILTAAVDSLPWSRQRRRARAVPLSRQSSPVRPANDQTLGEGIECPSFGFRVLPSLLSSSPFLGVEEWMPFCHYPLWAGFL